MIHYMTTNGVGDAWVGNELRVVRRHGIPFKIHSLTEPRNSYFSSADIQEMAEETNEIYPLSWTSVLISTLAAVPRFRGAFFAALWNALTGKRESLRIRAVGIWHLMVACHWAGVLKSETVSHIHSQWIHSAGTVAMYGAWLIGRPYSFTGHAADLFRERCALRDKIRRASFIVCISEFHRQFYLDNGARPEQLVVAYCGIDTAHFAPNRRVRPEGEPVHILSSGRLVEKKGFHVLIEACVLLRDRGLDFRCTIAGSGPMEAELRSQVLANGLEDLVAITGTALKQEDIPAFMVTGDVYCLPCVWASDNDVDGLPQMLMEAMACGLPAASTRLVGIPDLIRHEETGLLTDSGDAKGLAEALVRLIDDPAFATRLAEAGRDHLVENFDINTCLEPLIKRYTAAMEGNS